MILLLFLFISILIIVKQSLAWTGYTHEWICDRAGLSELNCALADTPKAQSQHPTASFRNHHCTANMYDCAARKVARTFLESSTPEGKDLAAHLFADSMVPVHWYSLDYDTCHKILEDKVEEKLKEADNVKYDLFKSSYDMSKWNVSMQCQLKDNKTVDLYVDDVYMNTVANYVAAEMHSTYTPTVVKEYDLTPILYVVLAVLILLLVLFIWMGMKNRKKK